MRLDSARRNERKHGLDASTLQESCTEIESTKTLLSIASGLSPVVAPLTTIVPPVRTFFIECFQIAAPTLSNTASTCCGKYTPEAKV
jgi:hypothetical protein